MDAITHAPGSFAPIRLAAGATIVEFRRAGDRWRHAISTSDGRVWQSVEGSADPAGDPRWPASPVLTEVTLTQAGGRSAVLGLGLAGRSHFSLCVTIHASEPNTLLFEAACRLGDMPGWLGSTYCPPGGDTISLEPLGPAPTPPATVLWSYLVGPGGPTLLPSPAFGRAAGG